MFGSYEVVVELIRRQSVQGGLSRRPLSFFLCVRHLSTANMSNGVPLSQLPFAVKEDEVQTSFREGEKCLWTKI